MHDLRVSWLSRFRDSGTGSTADKVFKVLQDAYWAKRLWFNLLLQRNKRVSCLLSR